MRRQILYIVPTYGVPVKPAALAVDSVISMMYAGHEDMKPPLRNPYSAAVGSRPPHFAEWSDGSGRAAEFQDVRGDAAGRTERGDRQGAGG